MSDDPSSSPVRSPSTAGTKSSAIPPSLTPSCEAADVRSSQDRSAAGQADRHRLTIHHRMSVRATIAREFTFFSIFHGGPWVSGARVRELMLSAFAISFTWVGSYRALGVLVGVRRSRRRPRQHPRCRSHSVGHSFHSSGRGNPPRGDNSFHSIGRGSAQRARRSSAQMEVVTAARALRAFVQVDVVTRGPCRDLVQIVAVTHDHVPQIGDLGQ